MSAPGRRDRTRPLEVLGLAAGLALFVGVGVFVATRDWGLALVFFGVAFIASIVVLAMLLLAITPRSDHDEDSAGPGPSGH
jgi:hypothetical protein